MSKRRITPDEYETACEMFYQLTEILLVVGISELKISAKEREIFWDTAGGAKVDPMELDRLSHLIDSHWTNIATKASTS